MQSYELNAVLPTSCSIFIRSSANDLEPLTYTNLNLYRSVFGNRDAVLVTLLAFTTPVGAFVRNYGNDVTVSALHVWPLLPV